MSGATLSFHDPQGNAYPGRGTTFISSSQLTHPFNNGNDAGTWTVFVVNPDGQTSSTWSFSVTSAAPVINGLSPSSYPASGSSQKLTVNGSNFVSGATLTFHDPQGNAYPGRGTTFISSSQLTHPFNNGSDAGTWTVFVVNPNGQTSNTWSFTVTAAVPGVPALTLTAECSGTASQIRLNWTAASGATSYDVYRNFAVYATGVTGTQYINTLVTPGTTYSYSVLARNSSGSTGSATQSATAPNCAAPAPVISGLSPSSYPASGSSQTLTVNGSNFVSGATLTFHDPQGNAYPGRGTTFISSSQLTHPFNNGNDAGQWTVFVVNPNGQTSNTWSFSVTSGTLTGSLSPSNPIVGVTTVVFLGTATPGAIVTDNETWPDGSTHAYTMMANASGNWSSASYIVPQLGTFTDVLHDSISGASKTITYSGTGDFSASVNSTTQTVTAGQSTTYTVTFSSIGGFSGTVTPAALNWSHVPGATASWSSPTVTLPSNGSVTSTFTINTSASTTAGTYGNIILLGVNGLYTRAASTISLTVNPANAGSSSISGVVYSAGAIVGADITIGSHNTKSGVNGFYSISNVTAGDYVATVMQPGYSSITESVTIPLNAAVTHNFQLQPTASSVSVLSISSKYGGQKFFLDGVNHNVTFTANVDWGGHTPGSVTFITPLASYDVITNTNSASKTFNMGSEFGVCGRLRVRATSRDGVNSLVKEANFVIMQSPPYIPLSATRLVDIGDDFHYEQPNEVNLTFSVPQLSKSLGGSVIPKEIPFLGQQPLDVNFAPSFKSTLSSDGKINYGIDLSFTNILKLHVAGHEFASGLGGQDFKLTPSFNATGNFSGNSCGWTNWTGSVGLDADLFVHQKYRIPETLWLVYVDGGAGLRGSAGARLVNLSPLSFDPSISDISLAPYVKGTVGAGVDLIASVEGSLEGQAKWTLYPQQNLVFSATGQYKITSEIFFVELEHKVFQCDYTLGGGPHGCSWLGFSSSKTNPVLAPRDYLNLPQYSRFNASKDFNFETRKDANMNASTRTSVSSIQSSVFPFSDPSVSSSGNNLYLSWLYDDPARTAVNRSMAVSSSWNGVGWTNPQPIADDGTPDFHPQLLVFPNGSALATWEDANHVLPDNATLDEMLGSVEISTSYYDPTSKVWTKTQRLTNNNFLDRSPMLAGTSSDNALLVWTSNQQNDMRGSATNPNALWSSRWNGATSTTPQVITIVPYGIVKYDLAYNGVDGNLVLTLDTDNDPSTDAGHELYRVHYQNGTWGTLSRLTNDAVPDDNPQIATDSKGNSVLVWLKGDQVFSAANLDASNGKPVATLGSSTNIASFKLAASPNGGIALVWAEANATSNSDLQAVFYDPILDVWGNKEQLTSDQLLKEHLTVTFDGNNNLIAVYDGTASSSAGTSGSYLGNKKILSTPTPITTDLYMLQHTVSGDLAIMPNSLTVFPPNPRPGDAVTLSATVINQGDVAVQGVPVNFYQGTPASGGVVIGTATVSTILVPGTQQQVSIPWMPGLTNNPYSIYVVVDPNQIFNDANRANNVASVQVIQPDLAIQSVRWERQKDNSVLVTARIVNLGSLPSTPTTVSFRRDSSTGTLLSSPPLGVLNPDQSADIAIQWDTTGLGAPEYTLYLMADPDNTVDEYDKTNNAATLVFALNQNTSTIQIIPDQSGPAPNQAAALDSVLFTRDPFSVINGSNLLNTGSDRNTRVIIFAGDLQLAPGETAAAVVVNLVDGSNQSFDVPAEDVEQVPGFAFTQVIFRLPNNLAPGTCTIQLRAHGLVSNIGTIRITK